jgi:hypothetical protein
MIATTVAEVEWLNRAAREVLASAGRLGAESVTVALAAPDRAVETRELRVGDVVRATRNDAALGIFTGSVGTVVGVDAARREVTVALDAGRGRTRPVTLGPEYLDERATLSAAGRRRVDAPGLTHAYASTAHGVQGRTALRAYVLVTQAGMHRQAIYVAASRAAQATRFYGMSMPEPDEVERLDGGRAAPAPDPDDVAALAQAMKRDATQTMASVAEPDAAEVGRLMGRPPAWLWAEHAAVAARVGPRPPLAESLRRVTSALASTYGLSPQALECRPLETAVTRALQVPGSTPEAVTDAMTGRGRAGVRELDSAEDPVAVLVWAADAATERLTRSGAASGDDHRRLMLLDAAIARQRLGRLAVAETEATGPLPGLLGPPPRSGSGLVAWRRAAAAVVDYRDAAGMFERDEGHSDPWRRALADTPDSGPRRAHYDQVRGIVVEARTTMVLAELSRHVPVAGTRPSAGVEALARRPLAQLHDELAAGSRRRDTAARRDAAVRSAQRALEQVQAALDEAPVVGVGGSRRGRSRRSAADAVATEARARAEQRLVDARRRLSAAIDAATEVPVAPPGRMSLLSQAVAVRQARLRAGVLGDPPAWARDDVRHRLERRTGMSSALVEGLARVYGDVAVFADRWGLDAEAGSVDAVVGERPPSPQATQPWLALRAQLRSPEVVRDRGIDLSR